MSEVFVGKKVKHILFGEGTVTEVTEDRVAVQFSDGAVKQFPANQFELLFHEVAQEKGGNQEFRRKRFQERFTDQWDTGNAFSQTTGSFGGSHINQSFEKFLGEYNSALAREISYIKTVGGKRRKAYEGKLVEERKGEHFVYSFEVDEELNIPEGTQITVWCFDKKFGGTVIDCDNFALSFLCQEFIGMSVDIIEFAAASWRLLDTLRTRMNELMAVPSPIVQELISGGNRAVEYMGKLKTGQETGIAMAMTEPITFIWGPPGTGKTETLARIALRHIEAGHRILMVSYSNVSVDGAVLRLLKIRKDLAPGIALRYGYPKVEEVKEHRYLTSYSYVLKKHPELDNERKQLLERRKRVKPSSKEYFSIAKRLAEIKETIRNEEKEAVNNAQFVATTISKAVVDSTVYKGIFDVVIIDEASMAYVPQVIFSASLAKEHFICIGDFQQLPPIVQSGDDSVLNKDIFEYCSITRAIEEGDSHRWLCMLDTQYRMEPEIADFASTYIYRGLLKTGDGIKKKRKDIRNAAPFKEKSLNAVDLTGVMSVCTQTGDYSSINVLSAFISMFYAVQGAVQYEVGIITPYHAQSRILHAMSMDIDNADQKLKTIACATVHQFQGSEKDIIIYDAVECYRRKYPSKMLTSMTYNYANRLFNVALTRSKGKFISFEHGTFLRNKNLKKELVFRNLMDAYEKESPTIDELLKSSKMAENEVFQFMGKSGLKEYLNDIKEAKSEIRADIAGDAFANSELSQIADGLEKKKKNIKVLVRAETTVGLPEKMKNMAKESYYAVNPVTIIDKEIVWYGMPTSKATFITEGTVIPTNYYPVFRFTGKHTAKVLYGFLRMGG